MKITSIETILVRIPFIPTDGDTGFGGKTWSTVDTLLVKVETDEGITGWGEAFGYNVIPATKAALDQIITPLLIGRDATAGGPLMAEMLQKLHLFGRGGPVIYGLSGIDIALWDIAGKRAKLPVNQLLGGAAHTSLPCYASLMPYHDSKKVAAATSRAVKLGYEYVKLHEIAVPEVRTARQAAGPGIKMMVDTNCPWTQGEAVSMANQFREYDLHWLEEPVWPPENYAALSHVRKTCGIPISAGENCPTVMSFQHMFEAGAVDIAQPSPTKIGGITELRQVAAVAAVHNVQVIPHTPYFGPGYLAGLHLSSTFRTVTPVEWLFVDMETTLYGGAIVPNQGKISIPTGPGLGFDPDPGVIARFRKS
ncbi:MAG: mandelate racemase/muconate lactonizing enzyme family protein [Burkholderiales bacterium]